jgi:hypothetical protein
MRTYRPPEAPQAMFRGLLISGTSGANATDGTVNSAVGVAAGCTRPTLTALTDLLNDSWRSQQNRDGLDRCR